MQLLVSVISILALFGLCVFVASRLALNWLAAPLVVMSFIIAVLYVFGLAGYLFLGLVLVNISGLLAAAHFLRARRWRAWSAAPAQEWLAAGVIAIALLAFLVFFPSDYIFRGWDEFSHWALSGKVIYRTDSLYLADSAVYFKHYPPAAALFQYYWLSSFGYGEAHQVHAQVALVFGALLGTFALLVEDRLLAALGALSSISLIYVFGYKLTLMDVDVLVGVSFAALLAFSIRIDLGWRQIAALCVLMAVFNLDKPIALVLSLVVLGTLALCSGLDLLRRYRAAAPGGALLYVMLGRWVAQLACVFAAMATSFYSWKWYVTKIGAWQSLAYPSLGEFLAEPLLTRVRITVSGFISKYTTEASIHFGELLNMPPFSLSQVVQALAVLSLVLVVINLRRQGGRLLGSFVLVGGGAFAYLSFLLFCYLVYFSEYEGTRLASYHRYTNSYIIAWTLVVMALFWRSLQDLGSGRRRYVLAAAACAFAALTAPREMYDHFNRQEDSGQIQMRHDMGAVSELAARHVRPGEAVYFVFQHTSGYENYMFRYLMAPIRTQWGCWSLGAKYDQDDIWTCDVPLDKAIKGYAVLAIGHADEAFWARNGRFFDAADRGLEKGVFRIEYVDGVVSRLTRLQ